MPSKIIKPDGKVLIVSASLAEISPVLSYLKPADSSSDGVESYFLKTLQIDVLVTGVGMVATAYSLAVALCDKKYDLVLNAGIAGSLTQFLSIGEVVVVRNDLFADLGAETESGFLDLFQLGLVPESEISHYNRGLESSTVYPLRSLSHLRDASGATVNSVHGSEKSIEVFRSRCHADIETMEGAAFFYSCFRKDTNCMQIRAISNYVESRNKANWNIPLAVKNLNAILLNILVEISGS